MKRWMRVAVVVAVMIGGAGAARAQVHKVLVLGDDEAAPVADGLKAKIKASGRYAVTDKLAEAELTAELTCYKIKVGVVCALSIIYFPAKVSPLTSHLGAYLISDPDAASAAGHGFEIFVGNTGDERLQNAEGDLLREVELFCREAGSKGHCAAAR
jgi:hypothetical protein